MYFQVHEGNRYVVPRLYSWRNAARKAALSRLIDDKPSRENNDDFASTDGWRYPFHNPMKKKERKCSTIGSLSIIFLDLISVSAGYGTNLLEKTPNRPRRTLNDLLPEVSQKALDLISNLIVFNPTQRLTAVEALEHPYVAEWVHLS